MSGKGTCGLTRAIIPLWLLSLNKNGQKKKEKGGSKKNTDARTRSKELGR